MSYGTRIVFKNQKGKVIDSYVSSPIPRIGESITFYGLHGRKAGTGIVWSVGYTYPVDNVYADYIPVVEVVVDIIERQKP